MAASNPSSIGYSAIWAALNAWPAFVSLVRPGPGTQVNAQAAGFVPPNSAQAGDRPSFKVGEGQYIGNPFGRNSLVVELKIKYPLQIASGSPGIDKIGLLNTVAVQALTAAGPNLGISGVYKWEFAPLDVRPSDPQTKRPEYTTIGSITITFHIRRSEFLGTAYT